MNTEREDIYTRVTNQIVTAIEAGAPKFRMPWHITDAERFCPINAVSKRPYRGINVLLLWAQAEAKAFPTGNWATFAQWKHLGASVRKGERATTVVLWKPIDSSGKRTADDESAETPRRDRGLLALGFSVFNAAQVDGYERPNRETLSEGERIQAAERVLFSQGAEIQHGGSAAFYDVNADRIHLPRFDSFRDPIAYYATLSHELTHFSGASHRLDRNLTGRFGSSAYAAEELVAELGSAFLCARLGLSTEPRPDHGGYISNWLTLLRNDRKAIFTAASKAQQAADWLMGEYQSEATTPAAALAA
ncbi:MAG: zincin-like metallopeptidase domain-containing protein [Planctomycetota bacterium]|nr:zincin-like metallopeptidase domain-containing protein [Planctomycetota bacterium]